MRINAYNISFEYVPGRDLKITDTLSRAYCNNFVNDAKCRIFIVNNAPDMPDAQLDEIKQAMMRDDEANVLLKMINDGWPCSTIFSIRDTLITHNDIKGWESLDSPYIERQNEKASPFFSLRFW